MLDIFTLGDEVLRQETELIKANDFDGSLKMFIDAMIETLDEAEGDGLAAPQVGVSKRIFVVHIPGEEPEVYINPEILELSKEEGPFEEGCLSIPGYYSEVIRPLRLMIKAQDVKGKPFMKKADGLLARVIQHENDHLYGKLYIDYIEDSKKNKISKAWEKKKNKSTKRTK